MTAPHRRIALVLGGARSGKSAVAERLIARWAADSPITYVATATLDGADAALAERVERHVDRRHHSGLTWRVVEAPLDLPGLLRSVDGPVLLDALGPWVASTWGHDVDCRDLAAALTQRHGDTVVVSDEVGLSIHPATEMGRWFVDRVGETNNAVATVADPVWLCVAGRVVVLPGADEAFRDLT